MSMLIHGTSQAPYMMIDIFLIYSEMTVRKDDKRTCAAAANISTNGQSVLAFSLLDNTPKQVVGCIIQKRILVFTQTDHSVLQFYKYQEKLQQRIYLKETCPLRKSLLLGKKCGNFYRNATLGITISFPATTYAEMYLPSQPQYTLYYPTPLVYTQFQAWVSTLLYNIP